jgi:hypothetical protein
MCCVFTCALKGFFSPDFFRFTALDFVKLGIKLTYSELDQLVQAAAIVAP